MRVVLFYDDINPKCMVQQKFKNEEIKIKENNHGYITLENGNQVIFKKINLNRPADLYKYKENDMLCYINDERYALYSNVKPTKDMIAKLDSLLKKERDFYEVKLGSLIRLLVGEEPKAYYKINKFHNKIITQYSYKKKLGADYTDSIDEAVKMLMDVLSENIKENEKIINNYKSAINTKENENKKLMEQLNKLKQ